METIESLLYGFSVCLTPTNLLYCALGVLLGTIVGVLPGIGPLGGIVPSGTPPDVVAKLRQGLKGMVEDEAFKALMGKLGERVQYMSGEDFEKFWEDDYKKVGALLKQIIKK